MLSPSEIYGVVRYLGVNRDRAATLENEALESVEIGWEGMPGESRGGLTRPSCSRVLKIHPKKGTEIRNTRQLSVLSMEELRAIGAAMELPDGRLEPGWIGASLALEGIPALTRLPGSSRLVFEGGAVLTVDVENGPCKFAAEAIEAHAPGKGHSFPRCARGRRGVVAWVEKPGRLTLGERCRLHLPPVRPYPPAEG